MVHNVADNDQKLECGTHNILKSKTLCLSHTDQNESTTLPNKKLSLSHTDQNKSTTFPENSLPCTDP